MREILFRVRDNGHWYYGLPLRISENNVQFSGVDENGADVYSMFNEKETLGQYTGLCDKNGKKIFEWDILKSDDNLFIVKWLDDRAKYVCAFTNLKDYYCEASDKYIKECFTVCGNIHDNPELLEGE